MKITDFWNVTLCSPVHSYRLFYPEDGGGTFLWNFTILFQLPEISIYTFLFIYARLNDVSVTYRQMNEPE
jgi:hypothetical protein